MGREGCAEHHDRPDDDPRVCMATRADVAAAIAAERERVAAMATRALSAPGPAVAVLLCEPLAKPGGG